MNWRGAMQRISKALMVPIVVLPVAALFIAMGEFGPDFFAAAGNSIIVENLPLLFAVGVTLGFTKYDGMAGFAAVVGHIVLVAVMTAINPGVTLESGEFRPNEMSVLGGIIVGAYTSVLYWRFRNIRFPEFLGLFSGKRFVPIITAITSVATGVFFGYLWPPVNNAIINLGEWIFATGGYGIFAYGLLNRMLIPTGLHHILQNLLLHVFGSYTVDGHTVTGELARFYAGDPSAGYFSGGFFVIMMFAIPAAALAITHESKLKHRAKVAGVMMTAGLTSLITGITEPAEFVFMFTAPVLYIAHSVLTGSALLLASLLGIRHYGYALPMFFINMTHSSNPWLLIPLGLVYAVIYYYLFRFIIRKFNYPTPGREPEDVEAGEQESVEDTDLAQLTDKTLEALGGLANLRSVDACISRLRVTVYSAELMDQKALDKLPASGISRLGELNLQIVYGSKSDLMKDQIYQLQEQAGLIELVAPLDGEIIPMDQFPDPVFAQGMLGEGVGFMPKGNMLVSPCAGEVVKVFPGGHAVLIKGEGGLELLLHIGLDTVELEGKGFEEICSNGQRVQAGQALVKLDLDQIKTAGKELHSALVVTNKEVIKGLGRVESGKVSRGKDVVLVVKTK